MGLGLIGAPLSLFLRIQAWCGKPVLSLTRRRRGNFLSKIGAWFLCQVKVRRQVLQARLLFRPLLLNQLQVLQARLLFRPLLHCRQRRPPQASQQHQLQPLHLSRPLQFPPLLRTWLLQASLQWRLSATTALRGRLLMDSQTLLCTAARLPPVNGCWSISGRT